MKFIYVSLWFAVMMVLPLQAAEKEKQEGFPEWHFCVAYVVRDADKRDARPSSPNDPFAGDEETSIPHGLLLEGEGVVDVAALVSRVTGQKVLTEKAAEKAISATVEGKAAYPIMDCYQPHHLFVFYSVLGKPVACIEVCFTCNRVKMQPSLRARPHTYETADLIELARILSEAGVSLKPLKSFEEYKKSAEKILKRSNKSE